MNAVTSVAQSEPESLLSFIAMAVRDPTIDVAKLDALLRMNREIVADQARLLFNRAFVAFSGELQQIERRGIADMGVKGSYRFAMREDLDTMIRPLLTKNGLSINFRPMPAPVGMITIEGELLHIEGHSKRAELTLPPDVGPGRNALQANGSAISYAERYLTEMLLNVVRRNEDTDGHPPRLSSDDGTLAPQQVAELERLMRQTRTLEGNFLKAVLPGLRSIQQAPAGDFPRLKNALLTKANVMRQRAELAERAATKPGAAA